jgi:hypothetical protein
MIIRLTSILLCAALCVLPAYAAELVGVSMPDEITVEGKPLVLNGVGLREASMLKVDVYVAGFYLEERSSDSRAILDSEQIKHIDMHFVYKKVTTKKLVKAWKEGLEANTGDDFARYAEPLAQLNGWMEDIVKGESMSFTAVPGKGLLVKVKGEVKGVVEDEAFAQAFWSIWLGPEPPNEGLKQGMLGRE